MFSYNEFDSVAIKDVSFDEGSPTIVYDGADLALCGSATMVSIMVANRSDDEKFISFSVRKLDETNDVEIFHRVPVPINEPFDILKGSKIFIKKGDILKAWTDINGEGWLDLYASFAVYTPSDLITP